MLTFADTYTDMRLHGCEAYPTMLKVEEPAVAAAGGKRTISTGQPIVRSLLERLRQDPSEESATSGESAKTTWNDDQDSGNGFGASHRRPHHTVNRLAQIVKQRVLLVETPPVARRACSSEVQNLQRLNATLLHRPLQSGRTFLWGSKESPGYRSKMEDFTSVRENLLTLTTLAGQGESVIPNALRKTIHDGQHENASESLVLSTQPYHFVGVFDGHGGTEVSERLAHHLPEYIALALNRQEKSLGQIESERSAEVVAVWNKRTISGEEDEMASSLESMEMDIDAVTGRQPSPVYSTRQSAASVWTLPEIEQSIVSAFERFNDDLPTVQEKTVGSTAIVSLISASYIVIANVGDSRAVLRRTGATLRVSRDHKPDQEDEEERIRLSGGRVWDFNGRRVMGLLAMTRAFGDDCLRRYGICATPEVTILPRSVEDEFLILACDGLWDVLTDDEASELVRRCFKKAEERAASSASACRVASSVLFRAAFTKGSNDNISVVVVDLRGQSSENGTVQE